jgi:hypothetical protein
MEERRGLIVSCEMAELVLSESRPPWLAATCGPYVQDTGCTERRKNVV